MLNKSCPHCQSTISIEKLKQNNTHKHFLARKPIPCPFCEKMLVLPALAEKLVSIGLLLSVILTPLIYYWYESTLDKPILSWVIFILGIVLILFGTIKNKAQPYISASSTSRENHEKK